MADERLVAAVVTLINELERYFREQRPDPRPVAQVQPQEEPLVVTIARAAELLSVSTSHVRRLMARHELKRIGKGQLTRIPMTSIHDWIEHNTEQPRRSVPTENRILLEGRLPRKKGNNTGQSLKA